MCRPNFLFYSANQILERMFLVNSNGNSPKLCNYLELQTHEAPVGDFSLDLLAKDLGSNRVVVVENQLNQTDHDHLGKLLTYAGGYDAGVVIWVAETIREEHRQALDWLNHRTDQETEFFGVVVEVLQIENSTPAYNFRAVVFPNDWQKRARSQTKTTSSKGEAFRQYFQPLIDELREKHRFTGARVAQPQNWYAFSIGTSGIPASAVFAGNGTIRVELYIDVGEARHEQASFRLAQRAEGHHREGLWLRNDLGSIGGTQGLPNLCDAAGQHRKRFR